MLKIILTILLIAVLAVEGMLALRVRSLANGWEKEAADGDRTLTDDEVRTLERLCRQMVVLGIAEIILFVLRFVFFDLIPLLGT